MNAVYQNGYPFSLLAPRTFKKEVLREGRYQHPTTPWPSPLVVDEPYIDRVVAATNQAMQAGVDVWVPDGHSFKAEDNKGFVRRVYKGDTPQGTKAIFVELDIADDPIVSKIGNTITKVSALLHDHPDGKGNQYGERIVHVALTPSPVAHEQENFVALSTDGATSVPVLTPIEEAAMPFKPTEKIHKSLGLDLTQDMTLDGIEKASDLLLQRALAAEAKIATPPTVEKLLSVDVKQTPYFAQAHQDREALASVTLTAAKAKGKLNADMEKALSSLLRVQHGYSMSADGVAAPTDVRSLVTSLLNAIPDNAVVPLGTQLSTAPGQPSKGPEPFDTPEKAKAEANRMLGLAGLGEKK